ncbi:alpha-L-rhamnosidase-related protein [Paenibacillus nasutitermitis]|uniref:Alpha-L-rhamnosidase n=1 Tax=Paenibacillus nasutitermitis TaxID=1652958 RepID=A0A916ZHF9_9BACL|nr:alpha-L-rhamnosidase C-terminal domain-containing protein [Paenibacillus nasutitermitis]GGD98143.1 hypothetical protein GCM10010911_66190 [Paenibacillus nasutitermitis]
MTSQIENALPKWIWHAKREKQASFVLRKQIEVGKETSDAQFFAAFTGAARVSFDGQQIAQIEEHPGNITVYRQIPGLPQPLPAGTHEISIELNCSAFVPVVSVNGYLHNRTVGFSAYLQGEGLWIVSDDSWLAGDEEAAVICLLGEEPFGDLDGGPDWFVSGGFGDIEVFPVNEASSLQSQMMEIALQQGGIFTLTGQASGDLALTLPERPQLELFYHLRKQSDWRQMRALQRSLDLSAVPSVTIDLKREFNARFTLENKGNTPLKVLWNGAESLHELEHYDGCITEWFEAAAGEDFTTLPEGMKYVRLYVIGARSDAFKLQLSFESAHVNVSQVGQFQADLPLMPQIYETAAHTSRICHQIGLWDGIKRDRLNWTFDFYLAAKSCYVLWDDFSVLKRAVRELGTGTPYGMWMNGIAEYTLWWIKTVCEYYFHTGDKTFVLEMQAALQRHVAWVEANIDQSTGRLDVSDGILIEWVPFSDEEKQAGLQAIYRMTHEDLGRLLKEIPELALEYHWKVPDVKEEAFMEPSNTLAVKILGIESGYVSKETALHFLQTYELKDPFTPLSAYSLMESYSRYGLHDKAYEILEIVWGGMLKEGATTFWEAFNLDSDTNFHDGLTTFTAYDSYRMSLCHAWSSTPVKWMSETVLGIHSLEPGFNSVRFDPVPVGGIRECEGMVNTPHGPIQVKWKLDENGRLDANLHLPEGIVLQDSVMHS